MDIKKYILTKKEIIQNLDVKPRLKTINLSKEFIISIIGPRRAGKTFFLYYLIKKLNLREEDYLFVNFEDYVDFKNPFDFILSHEEIYGKEPEYIFLDEIQSLDRWKNFVYSLYESKNYYIFITGSSSKLLSREIATSLRGRANPVNIYPLSFEEIFLYNRIRKKNAYSIKEEGRIKSILLKNIYTQFPLIVIKEEDPFVFFENYLDIVVHKDIEERYKIKNRTALELFIKSVISSFTEEFSVHKVFNTLKSQGIRISKNILYNFQKMLEDIQISFFLKKYSTSMRKIELSIPKIHLVDPGLYNYTQGIDISKTMENIVFLELLKKGYTPNKNVFYFKTRDYEVDLLLKENSNITKLIQVTYANNFDEINPREWKALLEAYELFKQHKLELIIITWDYEDTKELSWFGKKGTIEFIPLWKWLLNIR